MACLIWHLLVGGGTILRDIYVFNTWEHHLGDRYLWQRFVLQISTLGGWELENSIDPDFEWIRSCPSPPSNAQEKSWQCVYKERQLREKSSGVIRDNDLDTDNHAKPHIPDSVDPGMWMIRTSVSPMTQTRYLLSSSHLDIVNV